MGGYNSAHWQIERRSKTNIISFSIYPSINLLRASLEQRERERGRHDPPVGGEGGGGGGAAE